MFQPLDFGVINPCIDLKLETCFYEKNKDESEYDQYTEYMCTNTKLKSSCLFI
jgi:hypothetical protein